MSGANSIGEHPEGETMLGLQLFLIRMMALSPFASKHVGQWWIGGKNLLGGNNQPFHPIGGPHCPTPTFALFVSRKKWATLSLDLKKIVRAESGEKMARRVGKAADIAEAEAAELLQSKKITEVTAGSAFMKELRRGAQPAI